MMLVLDVLLAVGLLALGVWVVAGRTLFGSLVSYTVFGLLMALVWARLGAPDLALAEAAIGAGLTGAMLMLCYRRLIAIKPKRAGMRGVRDSRLALPLALASSVLVAVLAVAMLALPAADDSAGAAALAAVEPTPVANPVTAVLLLFRGYDTLLEMAVLLAAWLGVVVVQGTVRPPAPAPMRQVPLLDALLALMVPATLLVAGYLLHVGGKAPGGAFQAGAVLAAAGVVLTLSGHLRPRAVPLPGLTLVLVLGVLVFALLGLWPLLHGEPLLAFTALWQVYLIEAAMTISIALTLILLFAGSASIEPRR